MAKGPWLMANGSGLMTWRLWVWCGWRMDPGSSAEGGGAEATVRALLRLVIQGRVWNRCRR